MIKCCNDKILVVFDESDRKLIPLGKTGVVLYRPDEWLHKHGDDITHTTTEENCNYLETKPQIATIVAANSKYPQFKINDKIYVHYMAYESGQYAGLKDKSAFISAYFIFCIIKPNGDFEMAKDTYFGKEVLTEDEVSPNGIILNPWGQKPKACEIRITHSPKELSTKDRKYNVDEVVLTCDNNQYPSYIDGVRYIMLRQREIVGSLVECLPVAI